MTDPEFYAEAQRRTQKTTPSLTDTQWATWLDDALRNGATIVLQLDGCRAEYATAQLTRSPRPNASRVVHTLKPLATRHVARAIDIQ